MASKQAEKAARNLYPDEPEWEAVVELSIPIIDEEFSGMIEAARELKKCLEEAADQHSKSYRNRHPGWDRALIEAEREGI